MKKKPRFYWLKMPKLFKPTNDLVAEEIQRVTEAVETLEARAEQHEKIARAYREGAANIRCGQPPAATPLRQKKAA